MVSTKKGFFKKQTTIKLTYWLSILGECRSNDILGEFVLQKMSFKGAILSRI